MTVAISKALAEGARTVICASTGNTSASAAAYASRAGLDCVVVIPEGQVAVGKLAQALMHGARVLQVRGSFDEALELVRGLAARGEVTVVNSINPDRLAGQAAAAFELVDELGRAPDYVVLPVGNAGNITAYFQGFCAYRAAGRCSQIPHLHGYQAAGAAPIVLGHVVERPETVATAIRIGNPASWQGALDAVAGSEGHVRSVTDDEILAAWRLLGTEASVFCEPASAAGVAGLLRDGVPAGTTRRLRPHRQRPEGPRDRDVVAAAATGGGRGPRHTGRRDPREKCDRGCGQPLACSHPTSSAAMPRAQGRPPWNGGKRRVRSARGVPRAVQRSFGVRERTRMTSGSQLERSLLEAKERDELQTIAQAMALKTNARASKSTLIGAILDAAGVGGDRAALRRAGAAASIRTATRTNGDALERRRLARRARRRARRCAAPHLDGDAPPSTEPSRRGGADVARGPRAPGQGGAPTTTPPTVGTTDAAAAVTASAAATATCRAPRSSPTRASSSRSGASSTCATRATASSGPRATCPRRRTSTSRSARRSASRSARATSIEGACRPAASNEKYPALLRIDSVCGPRPRGGEDAPALRGPHAAVPRRAAPARDGRREGEHDLSHRRPALARSARGSAASSSRRRRRARPRSSSASPTRSRRTTPRCTSWCCSSRSGPKRSPTCAAA